MKLNADRETLFTLIGLGPLWVLLIIFLSQSALLAASLEINSIATFLAFLSVGFLPQVLFHKRDAKLSLFTIATSAFLIGICLVISGLIFDTSFDGQTYHQRAIDYIRNGWNFFHLAQTPLPPNLKVEYSVPIVHYPKFPWLVEATLYKLTGNIEQSKALNLIFLVCSAFLAFVTGKAFQLSSITAVVLAAALSLNPVAVCQLWTFYVDGLLASLILVLVCSIGMYFSSKKIYWAHVAGISLLILLQIKFTSVVIVGSTLAATFLYAVIKNHNATLRLSQFLFSYSIIGLVVVGWNPYMTNLLKTGNPIYPVAGYSPIGKTPPPSDWPAFPIVQGQQPESLKDQIGPAKMFFSFYSRTIDPINPGSIFEPFWKGSFSDYQRFVSPDLRLGAFGPLFPVCICISIFGLILRHKSSISSSVLIVGVTILFATFINPESWWARYVPQLWLLPIVIIYASRISALRNVVWIFLAFNSLVILAVNTRASYLNSEDLRSALSRISQADEKQLSGSIGDYYATELRLKNLGVTVSPKSCENRTNLAGSNSFVCLRQ